MNTNTVSITMPFDAKNNFLDIPSFISNKINRFLIACLTCVKKCLNINNFLNQFFKIIIQEGLCMFSTILF